MRRWPATRAADRDPAAPALCASWAAAPRASSGDSSPWRGRASRVPPPVQAALSPGTNTSSPGIVIFLSVLLVDFAMTCCLAELSSPAGGVSAVAFGNTRSSHGVSHSLPGPMCLAWPRPKATHPLCSLACVSAWGPRGRTQAWLVCGLTTQKFGKCPLIHSKCPGETKQIGVPGAEGALWLTAAAGE